MKETYKEINLRKESLEIIGFANDIIDDYNSRGFDLTLRQLYYQFVSRDLFPDSWADNKTGSTNNERSYKRLGNIINNGRLSGLIDWNSILDRTRTPHVEYPWTDIPRILNVASNQYKTDKWENQSNRIEIWVEKEALENVIRKAANKFECNYFSCRGYVSQSAMHEAAERFKDYCDLYYQNIIVLYLGDHDPSGLDMVRDIRERLEMFNVQSFDVIHIALTMDQIKEISPPPNPTKITDSRANNYIDNYGNDCWELDALDPEYIVSLIENEIDGYIDDELFSNQITKQDEGQEKIRSLIEKIGDIDDYED